MAGGAQAQRIMCEFARALAAKGFAAGYFALH
jgi:hypothetical protein